MDTRKITSTIRPVSLAALLLLGVLSYFCAVANSHAILLGTSVTGSAKFGADPLNYFDPANKFVPSGYLNAASSVVAISGAQTEFGYLDGAGPMTADFSDNKLTLTETATVTGNYLSQTFSFNDITFGTLGLTLVTDTFPGGINVTKNGGAISLAWAGANVTAQSTWTAVYSFAPPAPVPEPGTWVAGIAFTLSSAITLLRRRR